MRQVAIYKNQEDRRGGLTNAVEVFKTGAKTATKHAVSILRDLNINGAVAIIRGEFGAVDGWRWEDGRAWRINPCWY